MRVNPLAFLGKLIIVNGLTASLREIMRMRVFVPGKVLENRHFPFRISGLSGFLEEGC